MRRYNRRPFPASYDKGFLDLEAIRIEQAIEDAQAGSGVTPTNNSLMIATDVSTSTTDVTTGLSFAVVSGKKYTVRGTLFLADSSVNGLQIKLLHPTVSARIAHSRGTTTSASVFADGAISVATASPYTSAAWNTFIGTGWGSFEVTFVATASGTFDVQLSRITSGTATVKAGSFIEWWNN